MHKALFLLPNLDYHGDARQATLLATVLPRDRFAIEFVSMAGAGPFASVLKGAGIPLHGTRGERFFDLEDWIGLRRLIAARQPDVLHVWGVPVLRALGIATFGRRRNLPPIVLHSAGRAIRKGRLGWWDRRLLRRAARVVATDETEREALRTAGLDPNQITVIPPAVAAVRPPADPVALRRGWGLAENARLVVCICRMDTAEPGRIALWGFDIVRYLFPDLYLLLIGDGRGRLTLESFSRAVMKDERRVVYAGARPDAAQLLHLGEVVWVPRRRQGGTNTVLEAMAAGKPVVASALPNLAALVPDGATGFLVNAHDPPSFARRTRPILEKPELARSLGAAGRRRVETEFAPGLLAERFARLYDELKPAILSA
jgi:glycosyltransferase involved in cell wall biosynthesis